MSHLFEMAVCDVGGVANPPSFMVSLAYNTCCHVFYVVMNKSRSSENAWPP